MVRNGVERLKFGWQEWLGLLSIAMLPAMGLTAWGIAMDRRVTVLEANSTHVVNTISELSGTTRALSTVVVKIDGVAQDLDETQDRLERLETRLQ